MKRVTLCLTFLLLTATASLAQNPGWIVPGRTYLKLYISEDGIYRINKSDFTSAGVTTSFDPRTARLFNLGNQIPMMFQGEEDGVFNDNDFIEFFGERRYGGQTITRDANNVPAYTTNEYYNLYSDTNVYWIDWGVQTGLRYQNYSYNSATPYPSPYLSDYIHFETDAVYSAGENTGSSDFRFLNTEKFLGEGWYWTLMYNTQAVTKTFQLPQLYTGGGTATLRIFAYPQNRNINDSLDHSLRISVNGNLIDTLYSNDFVRIDTTITFSSSILTNADNTITITYASLNGFSGAMYFDLFELGYPKGFAIHDNQFSGKLPDGDTLSKRFVFTNFNSSNPLTIYDVKNFRKITQFTSVADSLRFTANSNARFYIENDNSRLSPFRIKARQVPDLVSSSNGADYLIVYNKAFDVQAEQLRSYRQNRDAYRSVKAEIEDIYDVFGFGLEDPLYVRYFVNHVYENWQAPAVKYLTLFGRGSLDPKKNSSASTYYINYVPVYGNPPSDGYFANFNFGSFFYYNQISVGRIPVYSSSEAQAVVDKIIAYENQPYGEWTKKFAFLTGGGTPYEQYYHQQKSNFEAFVYVEPPPLSSRAVKVYRTDTSGTVTFNYADSIRKTIDSGTVYVNFRGHAGSHDWEVGMQDPNVLNNGNKLPIILSLTCFTGENALGNFRGFGERFLYLPNKGAIGFIATTGWSYTENGNSFGTYVLQGIQRDTLRRLGELVKKAGTSMRADSSSFSIRHTVNCYNLIGDAASQLKFPKTPEFEISQADLRLSSETVLAGERQTLTIYPKNFGLYADTCVIRFELKSGSNVVSSKDTVYRAFKYLDTVSYSFTLDSSKIYSMTVSLDVSGRYSEENELNNSATITIPVKSTSFIALGPVNNSVIYGDTVTLTGLNPNLEQGMTARVMLELDTTLAFNSPAKRTFVNNNPQGAVTRFNASLPDGSEGILYHWRTSSIIGNDSSGWSSPLNFIYAGELRSTGDGDEDRFVNAQLNAQIMKSRKAQFPAGTLFNTVSSDDGIRLVEEPALLYVRSYGSNGEEASFFSVGERNVYIDGGSNGGLNLLKVSRLDGEIMQFLNLKMTSQTGSNDTLLNFLNTFDSTHYLMLLNAAYFQGGQTLSAASRSKLREFGSVKCDSIGLLAYFHTWSFIGYLGASQNDVSEMFDPCCRPAPQCYSCDHWTQSISSKNVVFIKPQGTVENIVGPASYWTDFSWDMTTAPNSTILFDVIGLRPDGTDSLLMENVSSNKFNSLSMIDASEFPRLNLLTKFSIGFSSGGYSPVLRSINVNFSPGAEMVLEKNSLTVGGTDRSGDMTNFSLRFNNSGFRFINESTVEVFRDIISDTSRIFADTVRKILKMDSTFQYSNSFSDASMSSAIKYIFRVNPLAQLGEFYKFNNTAEYTAATSLTATGESSYVLMIDGREVNGGENVGLKPEMVLLSRSGAVPDLLGDTSKISVKVNGSYMPYFVQGSPNPDLTTGALGDGRNGEEMMMSFKPQLKQGKNSLSIRILNSSGVVDSVSYDFFAGGDLTEAEIYNYPNPLRDKTAFVFGLTEEQARGNAEIRIYTTAGRLIKRLSLITQPGMNMIEWDGRDEDGDIIANGTYLYKFTVDNEIQNISETKKLVVLR